MQKIKKYGKVNVDKNGKVVISEFEVIYNQWESTTDAAHDFAYNMINSLGLPKETKFLVTKCTFTTTKNKFLWPSFSTLHLNIEPYTAAGANIAELKTKVLLKR